MKGEKEKVKKKKKKKDEKEKQNKQAESACAAHNSVGLGAWRAWRAWSHACVIWTREVPVTRSTEASLGELRGEIVLVPANSKSKIGTAACHDLYHLILMTAN